jgi:hypothetical protein
MKKWFEKESKSGTIRIADAAALIFADRKELKIWGLL